MDTLGRALVGSAPDFRPEPPPVCFSIPGPWADAYAVKVSGALRVRGVPFKREGNEIRVVSYYGNTARLVVASLSFPFMTILEGCKIEASPESLQRAS